MMVVDIPTSPSTGNKRVGQNYSQLYSEFWGPAENGGF